MTLKIRLSPSGPEIGNPPAQVGGSGVAGRVWGATGIGAPDQVSGPAAADVPGLEAVPVNLLATASGYRYDIECDSETFGTGGSYRVSLLGSTDNGATYPVTLAAMAGDYQWSGAARLHLYGVAVGAANVDHVKMQLQRSLAAGADLTYAPVDSTVRITEISPTS